MEGLDFAGEQENTNFIIVVNDNDMSIAENHGGLYKSLKLLRDTNGEAKCNLFKSMGLEYIYVNEGNNISKLIEALSKYVALYKEGKETLSQRKELLENQRKLLLEKQKNIAETIERLNHKLEIYEQIESGKRKDFMEDI